MASAFPFNAGNCTHYFKAQKGWKEVTDIHTYEDFGASANEYSDTAPQRWQLEFKYYTDQPAGAALLAAFDAHWDEARLSDEFQFTEKDGTIIPNVSYEDEPEWSHEANKSWVQVRRVKLIQRPA
jgi:hypothetical protein